MTMIAVTSKRSRLAIFKKGSGVMNELPFTRQEWFTLPLKLRQRWWWETDYSMKPPSAELLEAIKAALVKTGGE